MAAAADPNQGATGALDDGARSGNVDEDIHRSLSMRQEIETALIQTRAEMAHGATAQMDGRMMADARARRDDAAAELDRLEAAITAAGSHEMHAVASAYHQATRSRLAARQTLDSLRTQHAMVEQAWESADYDMQRGDAA